MMKTDAVPIAKIELMRARVNGERFPLLVEIGQPIRDDGFWRTPVAIHGLDGRLCDICGEDSLQSLSLALEIVKRRLKSCLEHGERLTYKGEGEDVDFSFDALFPPTV